MVTRAHSNVSYGVYRKDGDSPGQQALLAQQLDEAARQRQEAFDLGALPPAADVIGPDKARGGGGVLCQACQHGESKMRLARDRIQWSLASESPGLRFGTRLIASRKPW